MPQQNSSLPSHTSRAVTNSANRVTYTVYLLDGNPIEVSVSRKAKGEELLQEVFNSMNPPLEERDYFSLTFDVFDEREPIAWLDRAKSVDKQMKTAANLAFAMNVKFYPPDPTSLMEYTRYLFYLQIRDDVAKGKLSCSPGTQALLGSFVCQADIGDYTPDLDLRAIQDLPLCVPDLSAQEAALLKDRILLLYRSHRGLTTAEAEQCYLEVAKKLTMYGVTTKSCFDSAGVQLRLGVNASGTLVFRNQLRLNRFAWPKITKVSYKKTEFSITLQSGEFEHDGIDRNCVVFKMESQKETKSFWKNCIEHHQFFRLLSANPKPSKLPFRSSHPTLMGQTEYEIKKSATLNRSGSNVTDTFSRSSLVSSRRAHTLPYNNSIQASNAPPTSSFAPYDNRRPGSINAPPSPQSGEYEPRKFEQPRAKAAFEPSPDGPQEQTFVTYDETTDATITTTVKTSVRMPPFRPEKEGESPTQGMNGSPAQVTNGQYQALHPPAQPTRVRASDGAMYDDDDDDIMHVIPEYKDADISLVRTASIVNQA